MPAVVRHVLAALVLLLVAGPAAAQAVKVTAVRVGLPAAADPAKDVAKAGAWAPVFVEIDNPPAGAVIVVEAPDADGVTTTLSTPVGRPTYVRPMADGDMTVFVRAADGSALSDPFRVRSTPRDPAAYVVLSLGGKLPGFDLPKPTGAKDDADADRLRGGRIELAAVADVDRLPDLWFGYDAVDLVVLTTATVPDEFLRRLFGPSPTPADAAKRDALTEWVRRGGRMIVSVGEKAKLVADLPGLRTLLPADIDSARDVESLTLYWANRDTGTTPVGSTALSPKAGVMPVANFAAKAGHPFRVVMPPAARSEVKPAVAVQAPFVVGKVTVVGFDLDRPPFTEAGQRAEIWDWVLREGGAARASIGPEGRKAPNPGDEDELAAALRTHADTFDGLAVVSFGWVAMVIALYALLVGPVEYYFLKRVLGRLELTWLTFPLIVLTVSGAAYATAVAVKGRDARVNKIDIVEVDVASGRVYGTTWATVFSPRTDSYTVAVTPAAGLTAAPEAPASRLVGWSGGTRAARPGLVRRTYSYHTDPAADAVADGLDGVPVQVWASRGFVAHWGGPAAAVAPVTADLRHPTADPAAVEGTFTNNLPFPRITDCVAFYAGGAYPLPNGTIARGQTVRLVLDKPTPAVKWVQEESQLGAVLGRATATGAGVTPAGQTGPAKPPPQTGGSTLPLWGFLFHEAALKNEEGVFPRNASLRRLDQSWRLAADNRDEVIVVGQVLAVAGPAEEATAGPDSPSKLWLRGRPGSGTARDPLPGVGRQETYVRMYLPVMP